MTCLFGVVAETRFIHSESFWYLTFYYQWLFSLQRTVHSIKLCYNNLQTLQEFMTDTATKVCKKLTIHV